MPFKPDVHHPFIHLAPEFSPDLEKTDNHPVGPLPTDTREERTPPSLNRKASVFQMFAKILENFSGYFYYSCMDHIDDHDLERYHLGMIVDEPELATFEEHLLACSRCAERAEEAADYVDAIRQGIVLGDFNLDEPLS